MNLSKAQFWALKMNLQHHQTVSVKIASDSMSPLIKKGESLQVEEKKHYKPFDIVIYHHSDGRLICHYIWQISQLNPNSYLLRSLKGTAFDLPVSAENILGYTPFKSVTLPSKILIFLKLLRQRMKRGFLRQKQGPSPKSVSDRRPCWFSKRILLAD